MRVYAAKLICSTGVSSFQTFKRVFCMHSELRLHAVILSLWVFDVILSSIQPSPIGQFWSWTMADREILNLHSKKTAFE